MFGLGKKTEMPVASEALPGRQGKMSVVNQHFVKITPIQEPFPEGMEMAMFGLGCFWGAEKKYWQVDGVYTTAVGYAGGYTPNPTYEELCTGMTGHNEVVRVVYDPEEVSYESLLEVFWVSHNPTQGMRQGNDTGTQYRSGIYTYGNKQMEMAKISAVRYQEALAKAGHGTITTEIVVAPEFFYAEDHHQQYLAKKPGGYCGLGGVGLPY